jgi:hypothetical protein
MSFNEELGALIQRYLDDPYTNPASMYLDLDRRAAQVRVIAVNERSLESTPHGTAVPATTPWRD